VKPPRSIPFFDYPGHFLRHERETMEVIHRTLERGAFILREELRDFEERLARFLGVKHAIGVADGSNAITLALLASGIEVGDEVILPSHTCIATPSAIRYMGALPVPVECGHDKLIDPGAARAAITKRTRAIMPVHLNGRTASMDALSAITREHELLIVEDAAQALGSRFDGRMAGTFGAVGTLSFSPTKMLGCFGDGGAIVTNDGALAERVYRWRDYGRDRDQQVRGWGTSSRLDNLQAAVLSLKLQTFADDISKRRQLARLYEARLGAISPLVLPPGPDADPRHFDVFLNYEVEAEDRESLRAYLGERGVATSIQWRGIPVHQHAALGFSVSLPKTDRLFQRCFLLPLNPMLTDDDVHYVCDQVHAFYAL